jgi:hypothetical protein
LGKLTRLVFGISPAETSGDRRGFRGGDAAARRHFEAVGETFVAGYHAALETSRPGALTSRLEATALEQRGFAYEGAAMALFLLDTLHPWKRDRWRAFASGPGDRHAYMVHVGAGWAIARVGRSFERAARRMDPLLRWLALDGWGFHDAYFHGARTVDRQVVAARIPHGYARRAYDQGVGRALWFVETAQVDAVARTIARFDVARRPDLWSGIGLAVTYAGGADAAALGRLRDAAGSHLGCVAQGAAFAAQARRRAGNSVPHTDAACQALCGASAAEAAAATDAALQNLPPDGLVPAYETWRQRLQHRFAALKVPA